MSELPLIDDPSLLDRVLRQFRLKGRLNPFTISPTAIPTFDIGKLSGQTPDPTEVISPQSATTVRIGLAAGDTLVSNVPAFNSTDVFPDTQSAIAAGTVLADTGQLSPATTWYLDCNSSQNDGTTVDMVLQWRNAADAANILAIPFFQGLRAGKIFRFSGVALNERFRLVTNTAIAGTIHSYIAVKPALDSFG